MRSSRKGPTMKADTADPRTQLNAHVGRTYHPVSVADDDPPTGGAILWLFASLFACPGFLVVGWAVWQGLVRLANY